MDIHDAHEIRTLLDDARSGHAAGLLPMVPKGCVYELADLADSFGHSVRRVVAAGRYPHVLTTTGVRLLPSGWIGKA